MVSSVQHAIDRFARTIHSPQMHGGLFELPSDAVVTVDAAGRILEVNAETERQFGYPPLELVGELVEKLIPQRIREAHQHHRHIYEQTTENSTIQRRIKLFGLHKNGREFPVDISLNPVATELGTLFYCVIRDTSEREAAIEELAMARRQADEELRKATAQIQELKGKLERENTYLREELKIEYPHGAIIGNTNAIRGVLRRVEQVAKTDAAVLILGETGTGKELVARTIHELSRRKQNPMVKINCAALPATLIESELFGREKGAYTGALAREIGRFEHAHQSTIFLDEIGELPQELQPKLLRVLQEGEFERLGSAKTIRVDVRVVAATNRDLETLVRQGKFREDLFYRLNVFPIIVPPLRERREDIPLIASCLLQDLAKRMGYNVEGFHTATMREFQKYSWPGNIRELRNVIERNLILNNGPIFRAEVPSMPRDKAPELRRLDEVDTEYLRKVLQSTHWRVRGPGGAAEVLGLKPTTLEARMKKLGIRRREAPPMDPTPGNA